MHGKWGRSLLAVLLAGAALLGLAGCHRDTPLGKSFRFPLSAEPRQLDPQVSTDAASVTLVAALFEGLARLNENGEAVPAAADWTVSDDGRVYTFRLKESYWSTLPKAKKGETPTVWEQPVKVTAADFVFGMQRAVMAETGSALAAQLFGIQNAQAVSEGKKAAEELGVKAVDEDTLTITLTEADAGFPVKLAGTPFMPCNREFFEYTAGRYGLEKAYVLTNGPFSLGAWNHGQSLLLNKNEQYHEAEDVYPATVRYVIQPEAEAGEALLAGTLDAAALRPDQLEAAREQAFHLEVMDDTIEYVWLNNSVTALSNASIRRALRDALAYDRIAEQLDKTICTPAQGYIAPDAILKGTEPYRNADNSRAVTTDRDKARRELSEGMAALSLTAMPALKVLCADDAYSINLARYVIQSWQSHLTLYFTLDPVPADQLRARLQVGNYQIAIGAQTGGSLYAMGGLAAFLSDAPAGNLAKYSSARFDEQYKKLSVGDVSRADVDALEKLLVEECPSIPLDFQKRTIGIPANNSGIILRPFNGGAYGAAVDFRHAGKLD